MIKKGKKMILTLRQEVKAKWPMRRVSLGPFNDGDCTPPRSGAFDAMCSSEEEEISDVDVGSKSFTPTSTPQKSAPR